MASSAKITGREDDKMTRLKFSLPSNTISLVIKISNEASVIPAGIVAVYGPES